MASYDNDMVPTVRIHSENETGDSLTRIARAFRELGDDKVTSMILQDKARLSTNIKTAGKEIADEESETARSLIRRRQYRSKSGYVGQNTLANSLVVNQSDDGMTQDIYPTAMNHGYEYGQAFEFGLKSKNYPAQHPMKDSSNHLKPDKFVEQAIKNSIK